MAALTPAAMCRCPIRSPAHESPSAFSILQKSESFIDDSHPTTHISDPVDMAMQGGWMIDPAYETSSVRLLVVYFRIDIRSRESVIDDQRGVSDHVAAAAQIEVV